MVSFGSLLVMLLTLVVTIVLALVQHKKK
ncbi:putative holin-like toxin [Paenibacillus sp. 481]